jgi:hypothetical protein
MANIIITIGTAVLFILMAISFFPHLGSSRATDVLPGRQRRVLLAMTALGSIAAAMAAAITMFNRPKSNRTYVLNFAVPPAGAISLDPVVARIQSRITAAPPGYESEVCRTVLKEDATWASGLRGSPPATKYLPAAQTVVLACLFRDDPARIDIRPGDDQIAIKRWTFLVQSLQPAIQKKVRLVNDQPQPANAFPVSAQANIAQQEQTRGFVIETESSEDPIFKKSLDALVAECTDPNSFSQANLMINHLKPPGTKAGSGVVRLKAIRGTGYLALCRAEDALKIRKDLATFRTQPKPSITIDEETGDNLLRYDIHTWSGLVLTGITVPADQNSRDSWRPLVLTKGREPFILISNNSDCALLLIDSDFCGFTDLANTSIEHRSALARAALMKSIDQLGAMIGHLDDSSQRLTESPNAPYDGPYLTQHELSELFTQSKTRLILAVTGLLSLALFLSVLHTYLLVGCPAVPRKTPN